MNDITKDTFKRYLISSLVSFISGFGLVLLNNIDNISLETLTSGAIIGILFLCVRAGVKAVLELYLNK
jgi:hypothetical protein